MDDWGVHNIGDYPDGYKDLEADVSDYYNTARSTIRAARKFESGATRNAVQDKPDYFGFTSALVTKRFGQYMHKHRFQEDGSMRDSDNWKKGFPISDTVRSLVRHVEDVKLHLEGFPLAATEPLLEEALCAVIFNAQSMLYEILKKKERE